jgi:hypothetical protein
LEPLDSNVIRDCQSIAGFLDLFFYAIVASDYFVADQAKIIFRIYRRDMPGGAFLCPILGVGNGISICDYQPTPWNRTDCGCIALQDIYRANIERHDFTTLAIAARL